MITSSEDKRVAEFALPFKKLHAKQVSLLQKRYSPIGELPLTKLKAGLINQAPTEIVGVRFIEPKVGALCNGALTKS